MTRSTIGLVRSRLAEGRLREAAEMLLATPAPLRRAEAFEYAGLGYELAAEIHAADRKSAARTDGRLDAALSVALAAERVYVRLRVPVSAAQCVGVAGQLSNELGRPEEALRLFESGHRHLSRSSRPEPLKRAALLDGMGTAYSRLGRTALAADCFERAVRIQTGRAAPLAAAHTSFKLGVAHRRQRHHEEAQEAFLRAHERYLEAEALDDAADAAYELGAGYDYLHRWHDAAEFARTARDHYAAAGNAVAAGYCEEVLAHARTALGSADAQRRLRRDALRRLLARLGVHLGGALRSPRTRSVPQEDERDDVDDPTIRAAFTDSGRAFHRAGHYRGARILLESARLFTVDPMLRTYLDAQIGDQYRHLALAAAGARRRRLAHRACDHLLPAFIHQNESRFGLAATDRTSVRLASRGSTRTVFEAVAMTGDARLMSELILHDLRQGPRILHDSGPSFPHLEPAPTVERARARMGDDLAVIASAAVVRLLAPGRALVEDASLIRCPSGRLALRDAYAAARRWYGFRPRRAVAIDPV